MVNISDNSIRSRSGTIRTSSPRVGKPAGGTPDADERQKLAPPQQRGFQSIPSPEALERLIAKAVAALRQGIYWDRGSILNIVT